MSTTPAPSKAQKTRKEKEKDKEREREKERKAALPTERLKTVVRRLPPNLPEDIFWQSVQPWVTDETASWKVYYPGKLRKKLNKENIPSRAYIAFKDEEQLALFSKGYDGHVFRDKAGVESQAVVEFAPYQKVPSEKRKPDTRNATIEKDEDYISFIEALKASENAEPVPLETLIASSQPPPPPKTTPLLEALKAEKSANRDKEAILRNHAHYNQIITRKEDKKKAAAAALPTSKQAAEASATVPGGKKSSKKGQAANGTANSAVPQSGKNVISSTSKSAGTTAPAANAATPSKPAKGPKPPRAPPPSKATGEGKAQQGSKNGEESSRAPVAQISIAGQPAPSTEGAAPASAPPRRSRPVIGLASRQFEAALSGVAGLANAATERKKREKEREAQAAVASATPAGSSATSSQVPVDVTATFARIDGSDNEKSNPLTPVPPTSPRKKTRRGTRRGGHHADADTEGAGTQVKVPSILQRADAPPAIFQKDGPVITNSVLPSPAILTASSSVNAAANNTRGGGRRGRGGGGRGGVGRGGAPSAPRGG